MLFLAGCVTSNSIPLPQNFWQQKQTKIVVARAPSMTPQLYKEGEQGLVDIAISDVATSKFSHRLAQYNMTWYPKLQNSFYKQLAGRGMQVGSIDETINYKNLNYINKDITRYAERDFASIAPKLKANELLFIRINHVGATRQYYGFIPLSEPVAYCNIQGDLIDLKTNQIIWRGHGIAQIPVNGSWDQPPGYPNFINALDFAVKAASSRLLSDFFGQNLQQQIKS
jgi:hypothetical protein